MSKTAANLYAALAASALEDEDDLVSLYIFYYKKLLTRCILIVIFYIHSAILFDRIFTVKSLASKVVGTFYVFRQLKKFKSYVLVYIIGQKIIE